MIWLAGGLLLKLSFRFEFLLRELRMSFWFVDLITVKLFFDWKWITPGFYQKYVTEINTTQPVVNPIQDGLFRGHSRVWPPSPLCHIYPTMMKLGTVISYLRKIQKIYKSRDISLEFCWYQHFFTTNQQILLHQERQI